VLSLSVGTRITTTYSSNRSAICRMSDTRSILCYYSPTNTRVYACVVDRSGSTASEGSSTEVALATPYSMSVCSISSTQAILVYSNKAVCLTLSGSTVSVGTAISYTAFSVGGTDGRAASVCKMGTSSVIVAYRTLTGNKTCCLTLSGTTLTAYTEASYGTAQYDYITISGMDTTHAIISGAFLSSPNTGVAVCVTLSGTTVSAGTQATFNSGTTTEVSACAMSSTQAIVAYDQNNTSLLAQCLSLSGTTITPATALNMGSISLTDRTDVVSLDASTAIVIHTVGSTTINARLLELSGTTITSDTPESVATSLVPFNIRACALTDTEAMLTYKDTNAPIASYAVPLLLT